MKFEVEKGNAIYVFDEAGFVTWTSVLCQTMRGRLSLESKEKKRRNK